MTSGARYSAVPQNVVVVSLEPAAQRSLAPSPFIHGGVAGAPGVVGELDASRKSPPPPPLPREPDGVGGAVMAAVRRGNSLESPKSVRTMWPSPPMRMFSGLRSR